MLSEPVITLLKALECELHEPRARRDHLRLEELIHSEFVEFGRSGRRYTRADILEHFSIEDQPSRIHAQDFAVHALSETAVLLTYRSAHTSSIGTLERYTLRSSVWCLEPTGWKIVFHQGTPTEAFIQNVP